MRLFDSSDCELFYPSISTTTTDYLSSPTSSTTKINTSSTYPSHFLTTPTISNSSSYSHSSHFFSPSTTSSTTHIYSLSPSSLSIYPQPNHSHTSTTPSTTHTLSLGLISTVSSPINFNSHTTTTSTHNSFVATLTITSLFEFFLSTTILYCPSALTIARVAALTMISALSSYFYLQ